MKGDEDKTMNAAYKEMLTPRQAQVYESIVLYQNKKGYAPTVRELCSMIGVSSTSTISLHLNKIEEMGLIKRQQNFPRAISIL